MGLIELMEISELLKKTIPELHEIAKQLDLTGYTKLKKKELVFDILKKLIEKEGLIFGQGVLDIMSEGFGFLRVVNYFPNADDIYVSPSQIRRLSLRSGDLVTGQVRPPKDNEKYFALLRIEAVNGLPPEEAEKRSHFDDLRPNTQPLALASDTLALIQSVR
jgi:transcription termination factor Rho